MREVRPTIKTLKRLPRDTFEDTTPIDLIANSAYERLNLYGVKHPLLEDARKGFTQGGVPDRHVSASQTYGKPVYEVRARTGAAWRGLVVLDADGDPWLVWAERHDQFNKNAGKVSLPNLMPTETEYALREREEAALGKGRWRRNVLEAFVNALRESVETGKVASSTFEGLRPGETARFEVVAVHDEPSPNATEAHNGQSAMTVSLKIAARTGWTDFETALTNVCLPFLVPDNTKVNPVMSEDGSLVALVDLTHAQIVQLLADPPTYDAERPVDVTRPDRLHYVNTQFQIDGFVNGNPMRGVCGVWFVASQGEECGLPLCEQCEAEQPAAQAVLDLLRSHS